LEPLAYITPFAVALDNVTLPENVAVEPLNAPVTASVEASVTAPEAASVVNAPVPAVVLPIEGGEAMNAVKPAPLTVPEAANVVTLADAGVVAPKVPFNAPETGPLNGSPDVPAWKSLIWAMSSLIALLMPLGAQPSLMLIPSKSVFDAGVADHSLTFVRAMSGSCKDNDVDFNLIGLF